MAWYPSARENRAPLDGGSYIDVPWRIVLHTTESATFTPASGSYFGHSSYPHFTVERDGTVWQHIDTARGARALRNNSGGVETNRARAVQIEVVGYAAEPVWPAVQRVAVGGLLRWIGTTHGVRLAGETFHGPGKFTLASESSPIRLAGPDWLAFNGVLGHQHVPENSHWDPGGIDLAAIVGGTEPDDLEGEHMGPGDKGPKVRHWQRRMIALGFARRPDGSTVTEWNDKWADADYGPATTAATKRLQDTVGYRPTGEVDADLRDRMVEAFTDVRDTNRRQALAARLTAKIGAATGMPEAKIRQLIATESEEAARDAVSAALADEYAVTIQRRVL